jgi:LytS/YehU family sensor histidine kinase
LNITFDYKATPHQLSHLEISPMLLQPFFENAIKHGDVTDNTKGWVKSNLIVEQGKIVFNIENTVNLNKRAKIKSYGVGLSNLKERLEMHYPDRYELKMGFENDVYKVELVIGN